MQLSGANIHSKFAMGCHFIFKTIPALISGVSIYLGYNLFILGVSGQASLVLQAKDFSGQLLNAAPGLFFATGGIVTLVVIVWKGVKVELNDFPGKSFTTLHAPSPALNSRQEHKTRKNR